VPSTPSWDFIIGMFFAVTIAYGFILQRERILTTLLAVYVGIVVSQVWSGTLFQFVNGDKTVFGQFFVRSDASPQTIQVILFLITIGIMSTKSGLGSTRARAGLMSPIELFGYSFLTAALILSTILSFLPEASRTGIIEHSQLASKVMGYQIWWVILPVVLMLVTGGRRRSDPYVE